MQSVINHIANSAQLALEGTLNYSRSLHIIDDESLCSNYSKANIEFEAAIVYNSITFKLKVCFIDAKEEEVITTDTIYSYNTVDMAEASVKFLLCQLLYKALHSDILSIEHVKQLQDRFAEAFNISIAII